jgi:hypothetical protein
MEIQSVNARQTCSSMLSCRRSVSAIYWHVLWRCYSFLLPIALAYTWENNFTARVPNSWLLMIENLTQKAIYWKLLYTHSFTSLQRGQRCDATVTYLLIPHVAKQVGCHWSHWKLLPTPRVRWSGNRWRHISSILNASPQKRSRGVMWGERDSKSQARAMLLPMRFSGNWRFRKPHGSENGIATGYRLDDWSEFKSL